LSHARERRISSPRAKPSEREESREEAYVARVRVLSKREPARKLQTCTPIRLSKEVTALLREIIGPPKNTMGFQLHEKGE